MSMVPSRDNGVAGDSSTKELITDYLEAERKCMQSTARKVMDL